MFSRVSVARFRALALGVSSLLLAAVAAAHQVWLEPEAAGTKFYFGEFGDNLHEVSPGYLDKLARPSATLLSAAGQKQLPVTKQRDGFAIAVKPVKGESLLVLDLVYPLIEAKEGEKALRTAWTPAARYVADLSARAPQLTLDVVPTGVAGEFQVFFRGKPLDKAELTLVAASGWSRQATSDAAGKVHFTLPWKGTYGLLVRHRDDQSGARPGAKGPEAYDRASFGTTLTFVTTEGLPSPPAPPSAAPNSPPPAPSLAPAAPPIRSR